MRFNKTIAFAAAGILALAGLAIAQVTVPVVSTVNPTEDRIQIVPRGQPSAQSVYASPAQLAASGYYVKKTTAQFTAMTAANVGNGSYSFTFANSQGELLFDPGGTLAYAYITFAPNPSDGARQCVFSTGDVTALYPTANTGQTLNDAATSITAPARICYTYSTGNLTWDRSQ